MPTSYQWYLEPLNDLTNQAIAGLVEFSGCTQSDAGTYACHDGVSRNMWAVNRQIVNHISKSQTRLAFKVWVKQGNGEIRPSFLDANPPRPRKKDGTFKGRPQLASK